MDTSATHGADHNNSNNNGGVCNKRACGIYCTENQEDANKRRVVLGQSKNHYSSDQTMITVESDDDEGVGSGPLGLKLSKKAKNEIIELISKLHTSPVDDDDDQISESCGSSSTPEAFGDVAVRDQMMMLRKRSELENIDDLELKLGGDNNDAAESTKEA